MGLAALSEKCNLAGLAAGLDMSPLQIDRRNDKANPLVPSLTSPRVGLSEAFPEETLRRIRHDP